MENFKNSKTDKNMAPYLNGVILVSLDARAAKMTRAAFSAQCYVFLWRGGGAGRIIELWNKSVLKRWKTRRLKRKEKGRLTSRAFTFGREVTKK